MEDLSETSTPNILDLDKVFKGKAPKLYAKTPSFVINYLKRKVHIDELNEILTIYADKYGVDFMEAVVGYFDLKLHVEGLDKIKNEGRYVFVSNHPLGGLDGICLSAIIGKKFDKKIKYLVNDILYYIKNLQPIFVPVNKYGKQAKDKARAIHDAYASDDQIITFPAGMCSRKMKGKIIDLDWHKSFIQKATETKRDIVPIYFNAHNSNFFYRFANYRKTLGVKFNAEMLFLPDEMFKNKHQTFTVIVGEPIKWETLDKSKTPQQWTDEIRQITYNLAPEK
ncbi:1-acyl-sn-glycerol-3-phosphate acyltransferase [Dysgonomonas macrotermitis]|uniref:Putative hemolysin n=1 Tax=Dysgonomonas macrotermitis TaxID=1346286 RepID=A0A1M4U734_9BACT|nr:1-acyl-sn-glycerol-3-phosphate acyltransferase [Dysgonomonas macrotermitis]SHE52515.1 Putative hemolysin [Dysgonomonas macrotermitis]